MSLAGGPPATGERRALVVFSGEAGLPWLRLLRKGFRHCFVALEIGDRWVVIDPLSHYTHVEVYAGLDAERLAAGFRARGLTVVATRSGRPPRRPAPWRPHSCVEAVIRLLGLRAPWVWTPWQLHRHLRNRKKNLT
jgi:hypothetical protein